jgi:chromosome segregation ATPase
MPSPSISHPSFELEQFEHMPATRGFALVRLRGRSGGHSPVLVAEHDGESARVEPLPGFDREEGRWAFSVRDELVADEATSWSLDFGDDHRVELPAPTPRGERRQNRLAPATALGTLAEERRRRELAEQRAQEAAGLTDALADVEKARTELQSKLAAEEKHHGAAEEKVEALAHELETLAERLKRTEEEGMAASAAQTAAAAAWAEERRALEALKEEAELEAENRAQLARDAEARAAAALEGRRAAEARAQDAERAVEAARAEIARLETELAELREDAESALQRSEERADDLETEKVALEARVATLETELDEARRDVLAAVARLEDAVEDERTAAAARRLELEGALARAEAQLAAGDPSRPGAGIAANALAGATLDGVGTELAIAENRTLTARLEAAEQTARETAARLDEARGREQVLEARAHGFEEALGRLETERDTLVAELEALRDEEAALREGQEDLEDRASAAERSLQEALLRVERAHEATPTPAPVQAPAFVAAPANGSGETAEHERFVDETGEWEWDTDTGEWRALAEAEARVPRYEVFGRDLESLMPDERDVAKFLAILAFILFLGVLTGVVGVNV